MRLSSAGSTDRGRKRANNEDSFLVVEALGLFAVADGVGGREGGEVASRIAVETLQEALPDLLGKDDRTPPAGAGPINEQDRSALRSALSLANSRIIDTVRERPELSGMGTTLTALFFSRGKAYVAHVGDSRAYLLRSGRLVQLTEDHSVVAEQVKAGLMTRKQAAASIHRHVITRVLGAAGSGRPDILDQPVRKTDVYLLCSDGLTEMVDDRAIAKVLGSQEPEAAVKKLIDAANAAGGVDNITVIVVKVLEP